MQKAGESAEAIAIARERERQRQRRNEQAPMETFLVSIPFSYFFLFFVAVVLIPFRAMQAVDSVCDCVLCRESPCAYVCACACSSSMRSWINTLVPDWQANSSLATNIKSKASKSRKYIFAFTHTHSRTRTHILAQIRHILFVLSYQYTGNAKQGQMQLFAQSKATATPTANSAFAKRERKKQTAIWACSTRSYAVAIRKWKRYEFFLRFTYSFWVHFERDFF